MEEFKGISFSARFISSSIVEIRAYPDLQEVVTLEIAKHDLSHVEEMVGNRSCGVIFYLAKHNVSLEARKYGVQEVKFPKALALIAPSWPLKAIGNFLLKVKTTQYPVKMFADEAKAIQWLENKLG